MISASPLSSFRRFGDLTLLCALALPLLSACGPKVEGGQVVGKVAVEWSRDVDQRNPASPAGISQPAVLDQQLVIGGADGFLRLLDLSGSEVGRVALDAACESGALLLSSNLAIVGDVKGVLYGVDTQSLTIRWRTPLSSLLLGRPIAAGDGFLVQTLDNQLYRFDRDGKKQWSFASALGGLSLHVSPSPLVAGKMVYTIFTNGEVVALNGETGTQLWRKSLMLETAPAVLSELKVPAADPVLAGDALIVSFYQGQMMALSPSDGERIWERNYSLRGAPLFWNGALYAADSAGVVVKLDPASGESLWKREIGGELIGPVLFDNHLLVADNSGNLVQLDDQGVVTARGHLAGRVDRMMSAVSTGVLVRNNLGALYLVR